MPAEQEPPPVQAERSRDADEGSHDDERMCRYCLSGDDERDLIAPCACRGGQRYVHRDCLRKWQRSVLVTQPTHPAFYEDDVRQRVCSVCREEFDPPPPSRRELMASFTGPELAALLDVGCLIVCEPRTSRMMASVQRSSVLRQQTSSLSHWIRGVYIITEVEEGEASDGEDCIVAVNLTRPIPAERLPAVLRLHAMQLLGPPRRRAAAAPAAAPAPANARASPHRAGGDGTERTGAARAGSERAEGGGEGGAEEADDSEGEEDSSMGESDADDDDLERVLDGDAPAPAGAEADRIADPEACSLVVTHFIGGPCHQIHPTGMTLLHAEEGALPPALIEATRRCGAHGGVWRVGELADVAALARADSAACDGGDRTVHVFWGDARWSRTQLLGEIARVSWGMCHAMAADAFGAEASGGAPGSHRPTLLWKSVVRSLRPIYAPESEMSDVMRRHASPGSRGGDDDDDDDDDGISDDEDEVVADAAQDTTQAVADPVEPTASAQPQPSPATVGGDATSQAAAEPEPAAGDDGSAPTPTGASGDGDEDAG